MVFDLPSPIAGLVLGHRGPVFIAVFESWPNGAMLGALTEAQLRFAEQFPRIFSLAIIPDGPSGAAASVPEAAERQATVQRSAEAALQVEAVTVGSAVVILPRGVAAVMVRTFLVGLSLATRSKNPFKTFTSLAEAEAWFQALPEAPGGAQGLAAEVTRWLAARGTRSR
jgi:hypothetical protein